MSSTRHSLSKLDLLDYALEGARTRLGVQMGNLTDSEEQRLRADIGEIERRIQLVNKAAVRWGNP